MSPRIATSPESLRARGKLATKHRLRGPHDPETRAAEHEYRSERYLAGVKAAVADAPTLSAIQRDRLRQILTPVVTELVAEPDRAQTELSDLLADAAEQPATTRGRIGGAA